MLNKDLCSVLPKTDQGGNMIIIPHDICCLCNYASATRYVLETST
jgi:hypothetical protein